VASLLLDLTTFPPPFPHPRRYHFFFPPSASLPLFPTSTRFSFCCFFGSAGRLKPKSARGPLARADPRFFFPIFPPSFHFYTGFLADPLPPVFLAPGPLGFFLESPSPRHVEVPITPSAPKSTIAPSSFPALADDRGHRPFSSGGQSERLFGATESLEMDPSDLDLRTKNVCRPFSLSAPPYWRTEISLRSDPLPCVHLASSTTTRGGG